MEESIGDVSAFSLLLPGQNGSYLEHPASQLPIWHE